MVDNANYRPSKRPRLSAPEHAKLHWAQVSICCEDARSIDEVSPLARPQCSDNTAVAHSSDSILSHVELGDLTQNIDARLVCYGMLVNLTFAAPSIPLRPSAYVPKPTILGLNGTLYREVDKAYIGKLEDHNSEVLAKLAADGDIDLQLEYMAEESGKPRRKKQACVLRVILYGPENISDDVGEFLTRCGHYLQDPFGCNRNVPYLNPQRLSSLEGHLPMTYELQQEHNNEFDSFEGVIDDVLAHFETTEVLAPSDTPSSLRTKLHVHQKQALTFFKRREQGLGGIWTSKASGPGKKVFLNSVTGQQQETQPPTWRGGILADEMGLGKTLSIIALVASDKELSVKFPSSNNHAMGKPEVAATLIIVPPNVLSVWDTQLDLHTYPGKITCFKHYKKSRISLSHFSKQIDVVLTSYHTVEYEYRKPKSGAESLFSFHWKRIVLDEAHVVRSWKISAAAAMSSLSGRSRWAISGTPIQNSLTDFLGLFHFLHFKPYDDHSTFDKDIVDLWRSQPHEDAAERFRTLLSCVMIRRRKSTTVVPLLPRHNRIIHVHFDPYERMLYHQIETSSTSFLDEGNDMISTSGNDGQPNSIQQISRLRTMCNLGAAALTLRSALTNVAPKSDDAVSNILDIRATLGADTCEQCLQVIESSDSKMEENSSYGAYSSNCSQIFCSSCADLLGLEAPEPCNCEKRAGPCLLRPILSDQNTPGLPITESSTPESTDCMILRISSKVRSLLSEIKSAPNVKSVVFSFWTSTLDMIQRALQSDNIQFVRIDGSVPHKNRQHILNQFRNDPHVTVILITTSCGAVGLDLTAASIVHMVEPQWNPAVEEQAMARIHRIGQTQVVTAIRYVMEDSIEEHILNVQDRKKMLSTLLLAHDA